MIKIGDFAKICNVSTQTLRYYDAEGILKADVTDPSSGYRFYSIDAVEKYKQILFYKGLGFTLEEIKVLQSASEDKVREFLQQKRATLSETIEKHREQIKIIDSLCGRAPVSPGWSEMLLLPFDSDPRVVGKWGLCGELLDENDLSAYVRTEREGVDREIIFMPDGAFSWKYFWTKGILYRISPKYRFAIPNPYSIREQDGGHYMILQFMSDRCIDQGEDTTMLLYRQLDTNAYTEYQIRPNIDKTDLPFVNDEAVQGEWRTVDFVTAVEDFSPDTRQADEGELSTLSVQFLPRGICTKTIRAFSGGTSRIPLRYTKGFILDDKEMTAEEYQIKNIAGKAYLFAQHKSGDYIYGGKTPCYYVFERKEN